MRQPAERGSMRVGLFDDLLFREHDSGFGHPERPERLDAFRRGLREAGLEEKLRILPARSATTEELLRVHTKEHVARVAATRGRTVQFDPDTQAGPRSYEAALAAAGAVVDAVDRVLDGELDRAFCAVRPPGHHATADRAMGFCLFNNVAAGAAHAIHRGLERVAILDIDVHHGNGTQDIFWEDPRVLYVSSHAYPFYPGTGSLDEVGAQAGRGFTVNLPLPAGAGDAEYARVYGEIVAPIGQAFDPQLVLVSCGFDAHRGDPLAPMDLTAAGYAHLMAACAGIAGGSSAGKIVVALEGGYLLDAIALAGAAVVSVLLGLPAPPVRFSGSPRLDALLAAYREELRAFWPGLDETP